MPKNNNSAFVQAILDLPKQFDRTAVLSKDFRIKNDFSQILVSGMGGSAWPAEILDSWLKSESGTYISVVRTYQLPAQIPDKTLIVSSSYSGHTEEPLAVYQQAKKRNLPQAAITSNGQLKKLCQKDNVAYIEIPQGLVPRMATGYLFSALAYIMHQVIPALKKDALFLPKITGLAKSLKPAKFKPQAEDLAKRLKNKVPLIYTSDQLKVLGYIWKIKLNEGAKIPAFCNFFPELNHNEFSIFTKSKLQGFEPIVIILKNPNDSPSILKRMDLSAKIIKSQGVEVETIEMSGQSLLEKMFNAIILSDWLTYFLAKAYDIDPLATDLQEDFKKKMKE